MDSGLELLGLSLREPVTFLTDVLLAIFSVSFATGVGKIFPDTKKNWKLFFLLMALTAIVGGFGHLMAEYTGIWLNLISWLIVGGAVLFGELASIILIRNKKFQKIIRIFVVSKYAIYFVLVFYFRHFNVSIINIAFGFVFIVSAIQLVHFIRTKNLANLVILISFLMAISLWPVHAMKLNFHPDLFNHNDIAHVILGICFYVAYRGIKLLQYKQ